MYLRTTRRKNKDGSVVEYFQLAHNERHPVTGKPVAKIIHNFGRTDQLDRDQLVRLCRSIARVCQVTVIDPSEAMDMLYENAEEVEKTVFFHTANLFNLQVDLIFYDTTTASFTTDYQDDPVNNPDVTLRQFSHSKEGTWTTQVVVALAVTREGIPVRSWVLPGSTADVTMVRRSKGPRKNNFHIYPSRLQAIFARSGGGRT